MPRGGARPGFGGAQPGAGRPKGSKDKISRAVKDDLLAAYHAVGGVDYLIGQANSNPDKFLSLLSKLIPSSIEGEINHTHAGAVAVALQNMALDEITAKIAEYDSIIKG